MDIETYVKILEECQDSDVLHTQFGIYDNRTIILRVESFEQFVNEFGRSSNFAFKKRIDESNEAKRKLCEELGSPGFIYADPADEGKEKWKYVFDYVHGATELHIRNWVSSHDTTGFGFDRTLEGMERTERQLKEYNAVAALHTKNLNSEDRGIVDIARAEAALERYLMERKIPFCSAHMTHPIAYSIN